MPCILDLIEFNLLLLADVESSSCSARRGSDHANLVLIRAGVMKRTPNESQDLQNVYYWIDMRTLHGIASLVLKQVTVAVAQ